LENVQQNPPLTPPKRGIKNSQEGIKKVHSWEGIKGWVKNSTRKIEHKESYNELMLAIKIDGSTHNYKSEEDRKRQTKSESLGVRFLRFNDLDIKKNMSGILSVIGNWIRKHTNKSAQCIPCLSQEKEPTL